MNDYPFFPQSGDICRGRLVVGDQLANLRNVQHLAQSSLVEFGMIDQQKHPFTLLGYYPFEARE